MPLTDLQCRKAKADSKLVKLSDMGGLQLWIYPTGSKLWRFAYRFGGKQKSLALGRYPATTLLQARMGRDNAKVQLEEGTDPSHAKRLSTFDCFAPWTDVFPARPRLSQLPPHQPMR